MRIRSCSSPFGHTASPDAGVDREHGLVEPEKPVDFVTLFGRLLHSCRVDVGSSPRSSYIPPMMTSIQVVIEDAYANAYPGHECDCRNEALCSVRRLVETRQDPRVWYSSVSSHPGLTTRG